MSQKREFRAGPDPGPMLQRRRPGLMPFPNAHFAEMPLPNANALSARRGPQAIICAGACPSLHLITAVSQLMVLLLGGSASFGRIHSASAAECPIPPAMGIDRSGKSALWTSGRKCGSRNCQIAGRRSDACSARFMAVKSEKDQGDAPTLKHRQPDGAIRRSCYAFGAVRAGEPAQPSAMTSNPPFAM